MNRKILAALFFILTTSEAGAATYRIAVSNTSAREGFGGQNISGPALLIHGSDFRLFEPGRPASRALWRIAEEGDTGPALGLPGRNSRVASAFSLTRIPRRQVEPSVNQIQVRAGTSSQHFSLAGMLTSTNDGFAGVSGARLPSRVNESVRYPLRAWDAGSEENNEMCPFVPCDEHYIRKTEGAEGAVAAHRGISGRGDVDRFDRGWPADNVVGWVEITRIQ